MIGGAGKDTFVLKKGAGYDIIEDFSNNDQINVQGFNNKRVTIRERNGDAWLYRK